ncbi:MAG: hypothetical protein IPL78_27260 [Chloroflexi bacterium]|nr:hypothetical protein [Chloroflexota bacterium]
MRLDHDKLSQATPDNLAKTTRVVSKKPGEPAFIVDPKQHKLTPERQELTRANLKWLQQNPDLLTAIEAHHLSFQYPEIPSVDADAALYSNGFPSPEEEALCREFHRSPLPQKVRLVSQFEDPILRELAVRLLCRNFNLAYRFPNMPLTGGNSRTKKRRSSIIAAAPGSHRVRRWPTSLAYAKQRTWRRTSRRFSLIWRNTCVISSATICEL